MTAIFQQQQQQSLIFLVNFSQCLLHCVQFWYKSVTLFYKVFRLIFPSSMFVFSQPLHFFIFFIVYHSRMIPCHYSMKLAFPFLMFLSLHISECILWLSSLSTILECVSIHCFRAVVFIAAFFFFILNFIWLLLNLMISNDLVLPFC